MKYPMKERFRIPSSRQILTAQFFLPADTSNSESDQRNRDPSEGETCPQHHHWHLPGAERHHLLGNFSNSLLLIATEHDFRRI